MITSTSPLLTALPSVKGTSLIVPPISAEMVKMACGAVMPLALIERLIWAFSTATAEMRGVPPPASLEAPDTAAAVSPTVTSGAVDDASSALLVKLPDAIQPITPSATSTAQIYEARNFICPSPVNFSVTALSGRWAIYSRSNHTRQAFWHIVHAQVRHRGTAHHRTAFLGIRCL